LIAGTERGRTIVHRKRIPSPMQTAMTAAIGVAEAIPRTPTIGEITPASPKVVAPRSDAAVPACAPWLARASTWTQGKVKPAAMM
jgi:hypothetical protein